MRGCGHDRLTDPSCSTVSTRAGASALTADTQECHRLTRSQLPVASTYYYIRVAGGNAVGTSGTCEAISKDFMLVPTISYPTEPMYVVEQNCELEYTHVWVGSNFQENAASVIVSNVDLDLPPAYPWTVLITNGAMEYRATRVQAVMEADTNSSFNPRSLRKISFRPPCDVGCALADGDQCRLTVQVYPGQNKRKAASFQVVYKKYRKPCVTSVFPKSGPGAGGTVMQMVVKDYRGPMTRGAAGLVGLERGPIVVGFTCAGGGKAMALGALETNAAMQAGAASGEVFFDAVLRTPRSPCPGPQLQPTEVSLFVVQGGDQYAQVPLSLHAPGCVAPTFAFEPAGPRCSSVSPSSGNVWPGTGGISLQLALDQLPAAFYPSTPLVRLAGVDCLVTEEAASGSSLLLTAHCFRESSPSTYGHLDLIVGGDGTTILSCPNFYANEPPAPFIADLKINGCNQLWFPQFNPALESTYTVSVSFAVSKMGAQYGRHFDTFEVILGDVSASLLNHTASLALDGDRAMIEASFSVSALAGSGLSIFFYGEDMVQTAFSPVHWDGPAIEARGASAVVVEAFWIGQASALVGFTASSWGFGNLQCTANGRTQYATPVPASDWAAGTGKFAEVFGRTQLWTRMLATAHAVRYRKVVASTLSKATADDQCSSVGVRAGFVHLDLSGFALGSTANVLVDCGIFRFSFHYCSPDMPELLSVCTMEGCGVDDPESGMKIVDIMGQDGGAKVTVTLVNFPVVDFPEAAQLFIEGQAVDIEVVEASDCTETRLVFTSPPCDPGVRMARIRRAGPGNAAAMFGLRCRARAPKAVSVSPSCLYNSGGGEMEVMLRDMNYIKDWQSELIATFSGCEQSKEGQVQSYEYGEVSHLTSMTVSAPAIASCSDDVSVTISAGGRMAAFSVCYRPLPIGAPRIVSVEPASGLCDGASTHVRVVLENVRRIDDRRSVRIAVGATVVDSTSDPSMLVMSSFESTIISFTVPHLILNGNITFDELQEITIQPDRNLPSVLATTKFRCINPSVAVCEYVSPSAGFSGQPLDIILSVRYFGFILDPTGLIVTGSAGSQISRVQVLESVAGGSTRLAMTVSSGMPGNVSITVVEAAGNVAGAQCSLEFWAVEPRVTAFSPSSDFACGQTTMYITVENLDTKTPFSTGSVTFLPGNARSSAEVFDIVYNTPQAGSTRTTASMKAVIPAIADDDPPMLVAPRLQLGGAGGLELQFPASFRYISAPRPSIMGIAPSEVWPSGASTTVRLYVSNFPGAASKADLRSSFEDALGMVAPGRIVGFRLLDQTANPLACSLSIEMDVETPPTCPPGPVVMRIWNVRYPSRIALRSGRCQQPGTPKLVRVEAGDQVGSDCVRVPLSNPTVVVLHASNVDTGQDPDSWEAQVDDQAVGLLFADMDSDTGVAKTAFTTFPKLNSGSTYGLLSFGPMEPETCSPECCETMSCVDHCMHPTLCFCLNFYDDSRPVVEVVTDVSGCQPSIGGGTIKLKIHNFPILNGVGEVMARFGEEGRVGDVVLHFSHQTETWLSIVAPAWSMGEEAERVVEVSVVPLRRPELAVSFYYTYCMVKPRLQSCAPTFGVASGGERVCAVIDYFPFPISTASVTVGGLRVAQTAVSLEPGASKATSTVCFSTPPTLPGIFAACISPVPCEAPCLHTVCCPIAQVDAAACELVEPIPFVGPTCKAGTKRFATGRRSLLAALLSKPVARS